jgi:uncharacterized protein involved in outer membrane biogenesis
LGLKRALVRIAAVAGIGVLVAIGTLAALVVLYPQPIVEWEAARTLGRRVSFGSLKIGWGNPLTIQAQDIRLANPPWADDPYMFHADYLSAQIDTAALWHGVLRYKRLRIEKPVMLLERKPGVPPNWRFPGAGAPGGGGGLALVPKDRAQFPSLPDFVLRNGTLILRRLGGYNIRINFYTLTIRARGDDQPAHLDVDGAYNGVPVRLSGDTDSFVQLREGNVPFGARLLVSTAPGTLDFKGTLTDPVDFDGVHGTLNIDAPNLGDLLKIFGAAVPARFSLRLAGTFEKSGDHWQITQGDGHMPAGVFSGSLALDEGDHGKPDAITADLAFDRLDATTLLAGSGTSSGPVALQPDPNPGAVFDAKLAAQELVYDKLRLVDVKLHGRTRPGEVAIERASFKLAGGTVEGAGAAHATPAGGDITVDAEAAALEAGQLADLLGGHNSDLTGQVDGRMSLALSGPTPAEALKHSQGQAVLSMTQGRVSRDFLERASVDLRTLFRAGEGSAPLTCLLGVAALKNGVATVGPLRLRTPSTTLAAGGRVDLLTDRVDLVLQSAGGGFFALKVPLRISGSFAKLAAKPALGADLPPLRPQNTDLGPGLRQLADGNPCLR